MNVLQETKISLADACAELPGRNGGPLNFSTVFRWVLKGILVNGERIKLEAVRLGGRWITSREAIERFSARLTPGGDAEPEVRAPTARKKAAATARKKLASIGI